MINTQQTVMSDLRKSDTETVGFSGGGAESL